MKKVLFSIFLVIGIGFTVWLLSTVSRRDRNYPETFMHDSPQWHLPDGVKVRLGKGKINQIMYSPDGAMLAVGRFANLASESVSELLFIETYTYF